VLEELDRRGFVEWGASGNPRLKIYADECVRRGMKMQDVWLDYKDPLYPEYPTEKTLEMVAKIVEASSRPGDLVLDAFGGSGTTAVASEAAGRRWIYIDESPVAVRVALRRLLRLKSYRPFSLVNATGGEVPADLRAFVEAA
jgi:adenine-specific DNA-methyltransferase